MMINKYDSIESVINLNPNLVNWNEISRQQLSPDFISRFSCYLDWDTLSEKNFYNPDIFILNAYRMKNWFKFSVNYANILTMHQMIVLSNHLVWSEIFIRRIFTENDIMILPEYVSMKWYLFSLYGSFSENFFWDNLEKFKDKEINAMKFNEKIESWFSEKNRSSKLDVFLRLR
jgi:hypothetical protein